MIAICWNCGGIKLHMESGCVVCLRAPVTVPELVASSILSAPIMPGSDLGLFAQHIKQFGPWVPTLEIIKIYDNLSRSDLAPAAGAAGVTMMVNAARAQRDTEQLIGRRVGVGFGDEQPKTSQKSALSQRTVLLILFIGVILLFSMVIIGVRR